jgi:hypothetical protein
MKLYIQIKDGQPYEHPIVEDNFCIAYPDIDVNNLPSNYAVFERVEQSVTPGIFEKVQVNYEWVGNVVKDVWSVRPMTEQEKTDKIDRYKQNKPYASWTLDETTLTFLPPVPKPDDGKTYTWNESSLSWDEVTTEPAQ